MSESESEQNADKKGIKLMKEQIIKVVDELCTKRKELWLMSTDLKTNFERNERNVREFFEIVRDIIQREEENIREHI